MDRFNRPGDILAFVQAARGAAEVDNWFAALPIVLTLPDVCGAVDDPGPGKSKSRYMGWWDRYMAWRYVVRPDPDENWEPFTYLAGRDAYALRCSYLHSGTDDVGQSASAHRRIRFLGPPSAKAFGYSVPEETLNVGLEQFVEWICQAVEAWNIDRATDQGAQERLAGLVTIIPSSIRFPHRPTQP